MASVGVSHLVGIDRLVPDLDSLAPLYADAVQALRDFEHAAEYTLVWKVRPQVLFVEVIEFLAHALGLIGDIPWHQRHACELFEFFVLAIERGLRAVSQTVHERPGLRPVLGHAVLKDQVGEILVAQQIRLLPP